MTVSSEEKNAMMRLLQIMEGQTPVDNATIGIDNVGYSEPVELAGPGMVTARDVTAMAEVMRRLDDSLNQVSNNMLVESDSNPELREALDTEANSEGVKIGGYQIKINLDEGRMVNKQNYSVINKRTGETIAHELGLYEAAHGLVKLLNQGKFVNSPAIRDLLEAESTYTGQKIDAIRYKRLMRKATADHNQENYDLYEARRQSSMDKAMRAKAKVKSLYSAIR